MQCNRPVNAYGDAVTTPIFTSLITELGRERAQAQGTADELRKLVADLEALHEPDLDDECPTCKTQSPCITMLLLHRRISVEQAFGIARDNEPIDLVEVERGPRVPSLAELLAMPTGGIDRYFNALLGDREAS